MQTKQAIVLIHGMWSTPETMQYLKEEFEALGHDVLVPRLPLHYPKHELSDHACAMLGKACISTYVESLIQDIQTFMTGHPNQKPIILGHSMGALLAQLVASRVETERLIIVSSAAPAGFNTWTWSVLRTFGQNLFKFPIWRRYTNLKLDNIRYGIANTQSASTHKELVQNSTYESGLASIQISMWFLFRKRPTQVDFDAINCPVLVIGGTEDKITPIRLQQKIAKRYGNKGELKTIEGACHYTIGGSFLAEVMRNINTWLENQSRYTQA